MTSLPAKGANPAEPAAAELLCKTASFFQQLDSFSTQIDVLKETRSPGLVKERTAAIEVCMQRPNRLAIRMKDGAETTYAWICNGRRVLTYVAFQKKCTRSRAPDSIAELINSGEIETVKSCMDNMLLLDSLLMDKPCDELQSRFASIEPPPAGTPETPGVVRVMAVRRSSGALWEIGLAGGAEPVPMRIFSDLTASAVKADPAAGVTSSTLRVTFSQWRINAEQPRAAFEFTPPPGTEMVKSFFKPEKPYPLLNTPAPGATLTTLDGSHVDVSALRGKVVVLDFWQINCIPCIFGLPRLDALAREYKKKGVEFFAVDAVDTGADMRLFLNGKAWGSALKMVNGPGSLAEAFAIESTPTSVLIDAAGTIRAVHKFLDEDARASLAAELDALLAGRELPKPPPDSNDDEP